MNGHTDYVQCLDSRNDKIVSSGLDKTLLFWDLNRLDASPQQIDVETAVFSLKWTQDLVAVGCPTRVIKFFDPKTDKLEFELEGHKENIRALDSSGNFLVSGGADCELRIWDLRNRKCLQTITHHTSALNRVLFQNSLLYSADSSGIILKSDLKSGESHILASFPSPINDIFHEDSLSVASGACIHKLNDGKLSSHETLPSEFLLPDKFTVREEFVKSEMIVSEEKKAIKFSVLQNRIEIAVEYSDKSCVLVDVTTGKMKSIESIDQTKASFWTQKWFDVELKLGNLLLLFDYPSVFQSEVFLTDLIQNFSNEKMKLNVGEMVLRAIFRSRWDSSLESEVGWSAKEEEIDLHYSKNVNVLVTVKTRRGAMYDSIISPLAEFPSSFELPRWLVECINDGKLPKISISKIQFYYQPVDQSKDKSEEPLIAHPLVKMERIAEHLQTHLKIKDPINIYCKEKLVPSNVTLGTVKYILWDESNDLVLGYQ